MYLCVRNLLITLYKVDDKDIYCIFQSKKCEINKVSYLYFVPNVFCSHNPTHKVLFVRYFILFHLFIQFKGKN